MIGWPAYVIDPRSQFATAARFPDASELWLRGRKAPSSSSEESTGRLTWRSLPMIRRSTSEVLMLALRGQPAYIGAMGSKRAQAQRRERLLAAGVDEDELHRISAPIGLDLGAVSSEEVALSIMSELVAVRYGHGGGTPVTTKRRDHPLAGGHWRGAMADRTMRQPGPPARGSFPPSLENPMPPASCCRRIRSSATPSSAPHRAQASRPTAPSHGPPPRRACCPRAARSASPDPALGRSWTPIGRRANPTRGCCRRPRQADVGSADSEGRRPGANAGAGK